MIETYANMLDNLDSFRGTGLLWALFLLSLVFLLFKRDKSHTDKLITVFSLSILAIYFCPVWGLFFAFRNDGEILYRILWLLPLGIVVCYTLIVLIYAVPSKYRQVALLCSVLIIIFCGKYVYSNAGYSKAENIYHVPQEVVEICDYIIIPGREIKACFPDELVSYVRQYTSYVTMPFGRGSLLLGQNWEFELLQYELNREKLDADTICKLLRETESCYWIVSYEKEIIGSMKSNDFEYLTRIGKYDIYLDSNAYLGVWDEG